MQHPDTSNKLFQLAESFVHYTSKHLFLTGRAGTGKTTFLHHIKNTTTKSAVIVAPTGVAAINAGGVTMHSFFQLPFGTFIPENHREIASQSGRPVTNKYTLFENLRINKDKRKLFRELELLIIDEISMVRADMLDAVDTILRNFRKRFDEPFGGVQLLMIGDLYQLPPVVAGDDWDIMKQYYKSAFFFDALALADEPPVRIELQKIYRQKEQTFIDLLNQVRNNEVAPEDLEWLNERYNPEFNPKKEDKYVTLTSHNYKANAINEKELKKLPGEVYKFDAIVEGKFSESAYPADPLLHLKEGAQIMFIKNDKGEDRKYYNGKIGTIKSIDDDQIWITFPDGSEDLKLEMEEWENIRYSYNEEEGRVEEKLQGTFKQYPIRLAWAITIHKSQGLTFDRAVIDAGDSFTAGQVYVALSRLTSADGLVLHSPIHASSICCHEEVVNYMRNKEKENELEEVLQKEQEVFIAKTMIKSFDWSGLTDEFQQHLDKYRERQVAFREQAVEHARQWNKSALEQQMVGDKFILELKKILSGHTDPYDRLYERVKAANEYFLPRLKDELFEPLKNHEQEMRGMPGVKRYREILKTLQNRVLDKKHQVEQALKLAEGLKNGKESADLLQQMEKRKKTPVRKPEQREKKKKKLVKGETQKISLQHFKEGKKIEEIAKERGLATGTIEGHLAGFIKTGELSVFDIVQKDKVEQILPLIKKSEDLASSPIKHQLGEAFSFGEIRAVINHWQWMQEQNAKEIPS